MALTKVTYSMISGATFNVLDYGAVGDGVANCTNAFNQAITLANAATPGGTVYIPAGTYLIDLVNLKSNVTLLGETGTVLKRNGNVMLGIGYDGSQLDKVSIENIEFDDDALTGDPATYYWKFCIWIADCTNIIVRNCRFYNGANVAMAASGLGPDGIYISTESQGRSDILIENCNFKDFTRNGISITNGGFYITIRQCIFEDCALYGVDIEPDRNDTLYAGNITVEDCSFINNGDYTANPVVTTAGGLNIGPTGAITAYTSQNMVVKGCYFKTTSATRPSGLQYLSISAVYNMIVTDCIFDTPDTATDHLVAFDTGGFESDVGLVSNNIFHVRAEAYIFNNLMLTGNTFYGSTAHPAYFVSAGSGSYKSLIGNTFVDSGTTTHPPIQSYSAGLTITDNKFKESRAAGSAPPQVIQLYTSTVAQQNQLVVLNAHISDNYVAGEYGAFISVTGGSNAFGVDDIKITGNKVSNTGYGVIINSDAPRPNSFRIYITDNTFTDTTYSAIYLAKVSGATVNNNSFYNCATNSNVILLSQCSSYMANSNMINDIRAAGARAAYAINASGNPSPSALLTSNLSLNTQSGFTIAVGEGTVANNTTY